MPNHIFLDNDGQIRQTYEGEQTYESVIVLIDQINNFAKTKIASFSEKVLIKTLVNLVISISGKGRYHMAKDELGEYKKFGELRMLNRDYLEAVNSPNEQDAPAKGE